MDDIVERLRSPSDNEDTMKVWDTIRSIIADGDRGSWPRDIFESILSHIDEEREEAADLISTLRDRCAKLEEALEPFAAVRLPEGNIPDKSTVDGLGVGKQLRALDFRAARAALAQDKGGGNG